MSIEAIREAHQRLKQRQQPKTFQQREQEQQLSEFQRAWREHSPDLAARADVSPAKPRRKCKRPRNAEGGFEILLRAAQGFDGPFGLTALVLAAWNLSSKHFGLTGCEDLHPSDNKARSLLYGKRGLISLGYIERVEGGKFQVRGTA